MRLKKDKSGDTVGRPSWKSSLLGDPGAKFFCGKPQHMKNSLNFASTCLKVVDTRRPYRVGVGTPKLNMRRGPLGHFEAIEKVRKEVYKITEYGKAILKRNPSALTIKDL